MSPPPFPENPKLKVREIIQSGFCKISPHPPSVPSFSQIGWPQRLASGKLSQTVTLQCLIYIFTLFTLGSIYSTNASGAEQMPDASVAEDLNSERPWTNPTSGQSETWTRGLRIVSLRSCPLPSYPFMSLTRRGHDTFLCRITCKKAGIWTFFWLDRKQYGWFALFRLAKMPPSVSCCWFQSAFLLA